MGFAVTDFLVISYNTVYVYIHIYIYINLCYILNIPFTVCRNVFTVVCHFKLPPAAFVLTVGKSN